MTIKLNTETYGVEDISRRVSQATGYAKADTDEICREFAHQLVEITREGKGFKIPELFKTYFILRKERRVRNPRTEERMITPQMIELRVKVFDTIRADVRERQAEYVKQILDSQDQS